MGRVFDLRVGERGWAVYRVGEGSGESHVKLIGNKKASC